MEFSRRQLGLWAGAAVASGVAVGSGAAAIATAGVDPHGPTDLAGPVPFAGPHQAGVTTAAQDHLHFAVFDVITDDRRELIRMLDEWTDAARRMASGQEVGKGAFAGSGLAPPEDTGEAAGLAASGITITIGFGPSLFQHPEAGDRFGIAAARPEPLQRLPHFPGDDLVAARSDGDLCLQVCAHDPLVAAHAVRNLARIGFGTVAQRWAQLGFGRTAATTRVQDTPRNLFGQKDGTSNIRAEDRQDLGRFVWVQPTDVSKSQAWLVGGTYLVARRIAMQIETWDRTSLAEQESIIGRFNGSGAPLTGTKEFDQPDFTVTGPDGEPIIKARSHIALAHPTRNGGAKILRRGYNYVDGANSLGGMEAGLFFISFQRNPQQFISIQQQLARHDVLNEYLEHTGSGIWACPPGLTTATGSWADHLF